MCVVVDKMNNEQLEKYSATIALKEIKEEGQEKLLNSSLLVVGVGGLGSNALNILVSSGIGHIGIIDFDVVNLSNLPRQPLYEYKDIGKLKVKIIKNKLKKNNPDVDIKIYPYRLEENNAKRIIENYDIVLDCSDNFETKFLINDTCLKLNKPFVIAGVSDYRGQILTCLPNKTSDFKSLFSTIPHSEEEIKDVSPFAVSVIANIAANEVFKYLLNIGSLLTNQLLVVDTLDNNYHIIKINK